MLAFINCDGDIIKSSRWFLGSGTFPEMTNDFDGFYAEGAGVHVLLGDLGAATALGLRFFRKQIDYGDPEWFTLELTGDNREFLYNTIKARAEKAFLLWVNLMKAEGIEPNTGPGWEKKSIPPDWNS